MTKGLINPLFHLMLVIFVSLSISVIDVSNLSRK